MTFTATQGRLGRRLRLRRRLHGHRPGRPDPARARQGPRGDAEPGVAAVHQLLRDHRRRRCSSPAGSPAASARAHAARRPGARRRRSPRSPALSGTIAEIVGFRAGWGLGNALFIATALSVIVGAASGGVGGAIILYEAALGLGIASGPLLGGVLGGISWRGPFFGTAALMAIGFVAILVLLEDAARSRRAVSLADPLRALRHRGLLIAGARRALLQLRLLHAAGLHAVPAADGRARARAASSSAGACCWR